MPTDSMPVVENFSADDLRRVIRRSHCLRTLGLALGSIMVGEVMRQRGVHAPIWWLLLAYALVWPHLAWWLARRSVDPIGFDRRLFLGDAAMGGAWIALMQFNLLPSAVLVSVFAITLIAVDGWRMLLRGFAAMLPACAVVALVNGLAFAPVTGMRDTLAALPLLLVFPVTLVAMTQRMLRRVRAQNLHLLRTGSLDSLSGLLNRAHWETAVDVALAEHCCVGAAMLMIDIDRFKGINDQHGHTAGDEVIRRVGRIIRGCLREGDIAGRYGGDEFSVVLCGLDRSELLAVAWRICEEFARAFAERSPALHCTLSIGLAEWQGCTRNLRDWVKDADAALYRAKQEGRNRVAVHR